MATSASVVYAQDDNVSMEPWWNDIDGKTEELREKPFPVQLCPPQIPRALLGMNPGLSHERLVINQLSDGMATCLIKLIVDTGSVTPV
jgi:hypothetical protein